MHVRAMIDDRERQISDIQDKIIAIRTSQENVEYRDDSKLKFQELNENAIFQRKIVSRLEEDIDYLTNEIEDSNFFIDTLNKKITALRNSIETRNFLGSLPLEYCPECLTKIRVHGDKTKCKLCKEDIDESYGIVQARRMELEIGFQIDESKKLLELNKTKLLELEAKYEGELTKLQFIQKQVNLALIDVKPYNQEALDNLNVDKGFLEGEILQFKTILENAELYEKLLQEEERLKKEILYLKDYIYKTEGAQTKLKKEINDTVKEEGVYLLNNDLDRQDDFKNAKDFYIDYANNMVFLSNKYSRYSASSNFYLKVSARFAIFLASLSVDKMRYPRFIFADNMEDKGIEQERAQNLQQIIIDRVNKFEVNSYQIIYTTSYITEELNNSPYVVGEYYTKTNPSLKNIII